jgi:LPS export ABC transporter protein LptC
MRRVWLLLVFAAALALWLWRAPRGEAPDNAVSGESGAAEPGYVATGAELFDTDSDGQPQYRLRASRIAQPSPSADIELTAPQFDYQGDTAWTLTAQRGVLPPSAQQISLAGDVLMHAGRADETPIQMQTATLVLDMQAQRAETHDPVIMAWGTNRLWATGLSADMKAGSLRLRSPVHGEIAQR